MGITKDPFASVGLEPVGRKWGITAKVDEDFGNEHLGSRSGINEFWLVSLQFNSRGKEGVRRSNKH